MTATRPRCRHCPDQPRFPNPVQLRHHVNTDHPDKRYTVNYRLITPARGPRPGGSLKRASDAWPGRA